MPMSPPKGEAGLQEERGAARTCVPHPEGAAQTGGTGEKPVEFGAQKMKRNIWEMT